MDWESKTMTILEADTWSKEDLRELAKRQKQILWMIPLNLIAAVVMGTYMWRTHPELKGELSYALGGRE